MEDGEADEDEEGGAEERGARAAADEGREEGGVGDGHHRRATHGAGGHGHGLLVVVVVAGVALIKRGGGDGQVKRVYMYDDLEKRRGLFACLLFGPSGLDTPETKQARTLSRVTSGPSEEAVSSNSLQAARP